MQRVIRTTHRVVLVLWPDVLSVIWCGIVSKRLNGASWFRAQGLPSANPVLHHKAVRVSAEIMVLPSATLFPNSELRWFCRFSAFVTQCTVLSTKFQRRKFMTLNARLGLQHVGRDTKRYAVHLRQLSLLSYDQDCDGGWTINYVFTVRRILHKFFCESFCAYVTQYSRVYGVFLTSAHITNWATGRCFVFTKVVVCVWTSFQFRFLCCTVSVC